MDQSPCLRGWKPHHLSVGKGRAPGHDNISVSTLHASETHKNVGLNRFASLFYSIAEDLDYSFFAVATVLNDTG